MKDSDKHFEEQWREAFAGAELEPPLRVWNNIAHELGHNEEQKRPWWMYSIYPRIGAAAAVALLGIGAYLYQNAESLQTKPQSQVIAQTATQPTAPHNQAQSPQLDAAQVQRPAAKQSASPEPSPTNGPRVSTGRQAPALARAKASHLLPNGVQALRQPDGTVIFYHPEKGVLNGAPTLPAENASAVQPVQQESLSPIATLDANALAIGLHKPVAVLLPLSGEKAEAEATAQAHWWMAASAYYNSFQPNFSDIDGRVPSPLIVGRAIDSTRVASDLLDSLSARQSFSIALDFGRNLGGRWSLASGLWLTQSSYQVQSAVTTFTASNLFGSTRDYANQIQASSTMLSVPLRLVYTSGGKLAYTFSGGLLADAAMGNTLENSFVGVSYNFGNHRALNLSLTGSAGLVYQVLPGWGLRAEVNYRRSVTSVYSGDLLQARPHWIGLGTGLIYQF